MPKRGANGGPGVPKGEMNEPDHVYAGGTEMTLWLGTSSPWTDLKDVERNMKKQELD